MLRLIPQPVLDVDPMDLYPTLPRPAPAGRPWVMVNMIASTDGAIAVDGLSEPLGNDADQAVFSAIRACPDWILVAAGTARIERYDLPRPSGRARSARAAAGRAERTRLAVVSATLNLDPELPMFSDRRPGEEPVLILTGQHAPADAVGRLESVAEVVSLDSVRPHPAQMLRELHRRGAQVVLCEGGPTLNAQFADAGLIDELCLSIAPLIAGGAGPRLTSGSNLESPVAMRLDHVLEAQDTLFTRYLATSDTVTTGI